MKPKKKKTLFLIVPSFSSGGQERFVSQLTIILYKIYDIKLILFKDKDMNYPFKGELFVLKKFPWEGKTALLYQAFQLKKLMFQLNPDCCISFGMSANIVNLLAKKRGTCCYTSIRGYGSVEEISRRRLYRYLFRFSDAIIGVSEKICTDLKKIYPGQEIVCIYNAYNWDIIQPDVKVERVYHNEKIKLIAVSGLKEAKGYWHLLKALSLIVKQEKSVKLVIVGPDIDGTKEKMEQLIMELGIRPYVDLIGYQKYPHGFIKQADIFVLPSVREGFPNVLIEAMACGIPVIADNCMTGPLEILVREPEKWNGEAYTDYGVLISPFNEVENYNANEIEREERILADSIVNLIQSPDKLHYYANASMSGIERFSIDACRDKFVTLIG